MSIPQTPQPAVNSPPDEFRIRNWPLRDRWIGSWLWLAAAAGFAVFIGLSAGLMLLGVASAVVLFVALWRIWCPVEFQFTPRGVERIAMGRRRRIPWTAVESCEFTDHGVWLLPADEAEPLARINGLYIDWGKQTNPQRQAAIDCLERFLRLPREPNRP